MSEGAAHGGGDDARARASSDELAEAVSDRRSASTHCSTARWNSSRASEVSKLQCIFAPSSSSMSALCCDECLRNLVPELKVYEPFKASDSDLRYSIVILRSAL